MHNFFIYNYIQEEKDKFSNDKYNRSITVLFCPDQQIDTSVLQTEIKRFFEVNFQPDELHIIGGSFIKTDLKTVFLDNCVDTFKSIPKLHTDFFNKNLFVEIFDEDGNLKSLNGKLKGTDFFERLVSEGLIKIFKDNNGLIESPESHHYVFPSKKHCDKFLRTGNILLHTSQIFFIAFSLLKKYDHKQIKYLYCDTSSINSLAFALLELKKRFIPALLYPPIESFKSYEAFSNAEFKFKRDSLLLVSSSTSGTIIERLLNAKSNVQRENIIIVYFLGEQDNFKRNSGNILCDLTYYKEKSPNGIKFYRTYKNFEECEFCRKGSVAIEVEGDAFLNTIPKVNRVVFTIYDPPATLSAFMSIFLSHSKDELNIINCHYEENASSPLLRYEVYFDMGILIENIKLRKLQGFKNKLDKYINQSIPTNTIALVYLPDSGSQKLAEYIFGMISSKYVENNVPRILHIDELKQFLNDNQVGSIVCVAASVVRGRNLLFMSRVLRDYEKLAPVYFVGLARPSNEEYLEFLKKNLTQGDYGLQSNVFVAVEKMFCSNMIKNNPWSIETEYLKELVEYSERDSVFEVQVNDFFKTRIDYLEQATANRGRANKIFLPQFPGNLELSLHKTFAFFNFNGYHGDVSQGDVYFTISAMINRLRNTTNHGKCLIQTAYVRNLIDPRNFHRYNDGIIQASIIRAADESELAFNIDKDASYEMLTIISNLISHHNDAYGEGLMEFLLAIGLRKIKMLDNHLYEIFDQIENEVNDLFLKSFSDFAKYKYFKT